MSSRFRKSYIILIIILAFFALIGGAVGGLQTDWAKKKLVSVIEEQGSGFINGEIKLEKISGFIPFQSTFHNLAIYNKSDSVALFSARSLRVNIPFWRNLNNPIQIDSVFLSQPNIHLEQRDSVWNFQSLIPANTSAAEPADTTGKTPSINVAHLQILDGDIDVFRSRASSFKNIRADSLNLTAGFSLGETYSADLTNFSLRLSTDETDLPVRLALSGSASNNQVSLQSLLIGLGQNVLTTNADAKLNQQTMPVDSASLQLAAKLEEATSLRDWFSPYPLSDPAEMSLSLSGDKSSWGLELMMSAPEIPEFKLSIDGESFTQPAIQRLSLKSSADLKPILALSHPASFSDLNLLIDGNFPLTEYKKSRGKMTLSIADARWDTIQTSSIILDSKFSSKKVSLNFKGDISGDELNISAEANDPMDDSLATWNVRAALPNLTVHNWIPFQSGQADIQLSVSGKSYNSYPSTPVTAELSITEIAIDSLAVRQIKASGKWSAKGADLEANIFHHRYDMPLLSLKTSFSTQPLLKNIEISGAISDLNIKHLYHTENIQSAVDLQFEGSGDLSSLSNPKLNLTLTSDSSVVNGSKIEAFRADVDIADKWINLPNLSFRSEFADVAAGGRLNYEDFKHPANQFIFRSKLKDLRNIAPLLSCDRLEAKGTLTGSLQRADNQRLRFDAALDLRDMAFDTLTVGNSTGNLMIEWQDSLFYDGRLTVQNPSIGSLSLKDFIIKSNGTYDFKQSAHGNLGLTLDFKEETGSVINADYFANPDSQRVTFRQFDFTSIDRTFRLREPATVVYKPERGMLTMDTLSIAADERAYMSIYAHGDLTSEQFNFSGKFSEIDPGAAYGSFFEELPFSSKITGFLDIQISGDDLSGAADLKFLNTRYKSLSLDSLFITSSIADDRLQGALQLIHHNDSMARGKLDIPFKTGDPTTFSQSFFQQPVNGFLRVQKLPLTLFRSLIDTNTVKLNRGYAHLDFNLSGIAESPNMQTDLRIDSLRFGEVSIDSIGLSAVYQHEESRLNINGELNSLNRRIAEISGDLPLSIDLKTFEKIVPAGSTPIKFKAQTTDFGLNVLNGLVDNNEIRNIEGKLNAQLDVNGTINAPKISSIIKLENTRAELVKQGIVLRNITTDLNITNNEINLKNLSLKSNTGQANATFKATLEGQNITGVKATLKANNFQLLNKRDMTLRSSADVTINGELESLRAVGSITVNEGTIFLNNFGNKNVEYVQLEDEKNSSSEPMFNSQEIIDGLSAQINLTIPRNFWVRNRDYPELSVELEGELDLVKKQNQDFALFGSIDTRRGYAKPLSKRFEMEEGGFTFSGDPTNPQLNIRTLYRLRQPDDIKIWYVVEGTAQQPEFTFESEPEMEINDIISYTLFGKPFAALMGWQQGVADNESSDAISSAALNVLMNRVESYATENFGIDVIEIENNTSASDGSGTSIRAGKYISDRFFLALVQQLDGDPVSQVVVEYLIRRNLELIFTQSTDDKTGVDLEWRYEY